MNPKRPAVIAIRFGPTVTPSSAKPVLHDTRIISVRSPPQADPSKFMIGRSVWGAPYSVETS